MGAKERQIISESIKRLGGKGEFEIEQGIVKAVDENAFTIDVEVSEGVVANDVRLSAITESDLGMIPIPKQNSHVVIARLEGGVDCVLVRASEIDKWLLKIGNITMKVDSNKFEANGGNNKGLVKVVELTQKLNALEQKVNSILTALQGVSVALAPSGTFPFAPIFNPITSLTQTQQGDIEDIKFTH